MHCEGVCLYSYESGCDFQHAYRVSVRVGVVRMCVWVSEIEQTRKVKKAKGIVDTKREREREREKEKFMYICSNVDATIEKKWRAVDFKRDKEWGPFAVEFDIKERERSI